MVFSMLQIQIFSFFYNTITNEESFIKITILPGAYEIESLKNEIKRHIFDEGHYFEANYPFTIKANFSILGSIIEISPQGPIICFMFNDSIRVLLGYHTITLYEEYSLSPNPVVILSFDNIFLECDIAFEVKEVEYFIISLWMLIRDINTSKNSLVERNGI